MLQITIPQLEFFNEATGEFVYQKPTTIQFEHSLVSVSKWESRWAKPFLSKDERTSEETIDYIRCMTITQNVNPSVYANMPVKTFNEIIEYIEAKMTATWFSEEEKKTPNGEVITSEIIYYWMIAQNIPMECQKWHLNRLLALIKVCNIKNKEKPSKKGKRLKKSELERRSEINAARKAQLNTKG